MINGLILTRLLVKMEILVEYLELVLMTHLVVVLLLVFLQEHHRLVVMEQHK